jgi:hypothetical protein
MNLEVEANDLMQFKWFRDLNQLNDGKFKQ